MRRCADSPAETHDRGGQDRTSVRKYKVVMSDQPEDLVFQSVRDGKPICDNNILIRFI
jgi:hypothetical protein